MNTLEAQKNLLKVTFFSYSKVLKKSFDIVEYHKDETGLKLRAVALNWQIKSVEPFKG